MKKLIIMLLLAPMVLGAQESDTIPYKNNRHEINIGLTGLLQRKIIQVNNPYTYYNETVQKTVIDNQVAYYNQSDVGLGLGYKFHFNTKHAARMLFTFQHNTRNYTNEYRSSNLDRMASSVAKVKMEYNLLEFRPGYQFTFDLSKNFNGFTGTEFIVAASETKQDNIHKNEFEDGLGNMNFQEYTITSKGNATAFGFAPLVGIQYFITPQVSISLESKIDVVRVQFEDHSENSRSDTDEKTNTNSSGLETNLTTKPIGFLSLNMRF